MGSVGLDWVLGFGGLVWVGLEGFDLVWSGLVGGSLGMIAWFHSYRLFPVEHTPWLAGQIFHLLTRGVGVGVGVGLCLSCRLGFVGLYSASSGAFNKAC